MSTVTAREVQRSEWRVSTRRPRADEEGSGAATALAAGVPVQHQHIQAARSNRELRASENIVASRPIAATQQTGNHYYWRSGGAREKKEAGTNPPPVSRWKE